MIPPDLLITGGIGFGIGIAIIALLSYFPGVPGEFGDFTPAEDATVEDIRKALEKQLMNQEILHSAGECGVRYSLKKPGDTDNGGNVKKPRQKRSDPNDFRSGLTKSVDVKGSMQKDNQDTNDFLEFSRFKKSEGYDRTKRLLGLTDTSIELAYELAKQGKRMPPPPTVKAVRCLDNIFFFILVSILFYGIYIEFGNKGYTQIQRAFPTEFSLLREGSTRLMAWWGKLPDIAVFNLAVHDSSCSVADVPDS